MKIINKKSKQVKDNKTKYNWPALEQEFYASDFQEVTAFFRHKYSIYNRHIAQKTIGWPSGKVQYNRDIAKKAMQDVKENKAKIIAEGLGNAIVISTRALKRGAENNARMKSKEVKTFWTVLRAEAGLPTNITHNTNVNQNDERDIAASERLDAKLGSNKKTSKNKKIAAQKTVDPIQKQD